MRKPSFSKNRRFRCPGALMGLYLLMIFLGWITYDQLYAFIVDRKPNRPTRPSISYLNGTTYLGAAGVVLQRSNSDCGDAALKMVFTHFGIPTTYAEIRQQLATPPSGATMLSLRNLALQKGLLCEGWKLTIGDLRNVPLPAIVFILGNHYAVLTAFSDASDLVILDPARGRLRIPVRRFQTIWAGETLLFHKPGGVPNRWFGAPPNLRKEELKP